MREFRDRVAVVTGAASGIGRAFAERFAREGMKVVLADVEQEALDRAVSELRAQALDVLGVRTDVMQFEAVGALARQTLDAYGRVHLVCNNAGVEGYLDGPLWEATGRDWEWTVGVNFWGVVNGVRAFLRIMLAQDEDGHLVNTASATAVVRGSSMYGVTKHAVRALSETVYGPAQATRCDLRNAQPAGPRPGDAVRQSWFARASQSAQPSEVAEILCRQSAKTASTSIPTTTGTIASRPSAMNLSPSGRPRSGQR